MPHPKNFGLRDTIYMLLTRGHPQYKLVKILKKRGFNICKSRVSQIIKELVEEEYLRCEVRTTYKIYVATKKLYPYNRESSQLAGDGRKTLRIHNQTFKYQITRKSATSNDPSRWDSVKPMKNGTTQYIYNGHDSLGRGVTVQRMEGKRKDTLVFRIVDLDWDYDKLRNYDEFVMEKQNLIEHGIMHRFKLQMKYDGPATKTEYAITPAPYPELQQAFSQDNYTVGDLHGDSSKGLPELETTVREKAISIMEFLVLAESGRLPELVDTIQKIKDIGIPLEAMIEIIRKRSEEMRLKENESHERGVIG